MASALSTACREPVRAVAVAPRRGPDGRDPGPGASPTLSRPERPGTAAGPEAPILARRSARVLVVDDDDRVRRQLSYLLEDEGYEVQLAATGSAALAAAERSSYDVVILDVRLPDRSGIEIFEAFQSRSDPVKTIIVSGFLVDEEIASAEERGAHFLAKPVDSDRLLRLLASLERPEGGAP